MAPRIPVDSRTLRMFAETMLSGLGEQGYKMLRQAGYAVPRATREAVQETAGVFKAPSARQVPLRSSGPAFRMGAEAAEAAAPQAVRQAVEQVLPMAARRSEPPVMGVFRAPTQPAVRSVEQAAPDVVRTAAGVPEAPVPLEGRQLDLFSGFNRLTYPKGATTAEGTRVGGMTFNPADVMPEGQYTQRIRDLARERGIPEELFVQQMRNPGASLADEVDLASIPRGTGFFSGPVDFGVYQARNLLGNKLANLSELIKANPALAAGAAAGATGLGLGTYALTRPSDPTASEAPTQTPMGPTTETVDAGGLVNDPQAAQQRQQTLAQVLAVQQSPAARAQIAPPTYRGADGQTVITTRGEDEALTAAKQQYAKPEKQGSLSKYYTQREAYANFPAYKQEIVSELTKRNILDTPELVQWAQANPTLAYELLRKATGSATLPSQQTPQASQLKVGTPLGTNTSNNAFGYAAAAGQNAVSNSQGAAELKDAVRPQMYQSIEPVDPNLFYGSAVGLFSR